MGFTSATNPNLAMKVHARVGRMAGNTSQEAEDAAVADVLEELLALPAASGANGLKRSNTTQH